MLWLRAAGSLATPESLATPAQDLLQHLHCDGLAPLSSLSSTSVSLYSWMSPAASRMLCHTSQLPHWANTRPLFHATGLIMRCVVAPAKQPHEHDGHMSQHATEHRTLEVDSS